MAFIAFTAMATAAAEAAAAETAIAAAAELAAEQAAAAAAEQGITQAATSGLEQLGSPGIDSVNPTFNPSMEQFSNVPPSQPLTPAGNTPQTMIDPVSGQPFEVRQPVIDQSQANAYQKELVNYKPPTEFKSFGEPLANAPVMSDAPITQSTTPVNQVGNGLGNSGQGKTILDAQGLFNPNSLQTLNPGAPSPDINSTAQGLRLPNVGGNLTTLPEAEPSDFAKGFGEVTKWMKENPMTSAIGAYGILNATGALKQPSTGFGPEPYNGPLSRYRLSPNFQTYPQGPNTNIYQPSYTNYAAEGGIMQAGGPVAQMSNDNVFGNNLNYPGSQNTGMGNSNDVSTHPYTGQQMAGGGIVAFSPGGDVSSMYSKMLENPTPIPYTRPDVGIISDSNPNTRNLNAPDAALYYQKVLANRYGLHTAANLPKGAMGKINTVPVMAKQTKGAADDVEAAGGGIMQAQRYNLGGYAHGGNPRLLRGPGDGMSDNIPATIADSQPARLADGEFVVPADVVSGLGNGSTEAGAKQLHKMMDEIRMARTGKKAQGKQINPNKFTPK